MILKIADYLRNLHREEEGFTLIELLIVIAIIAVIAAIAIPMVASRIDDAREAADKANVRTLQGLVDQYYIDNDVFPNVAVDETKGGSIWMPTLVTDGYLHEAVESPYPNVGTDGYTLFVEATANGQVGKVESTERAGWSE